jgi:hypothetical protein
VDNRRLKPGEPLEVWIREGWGLERNWKINCGCEEAGAWKLTGRSRRNKKRLEPGKELEDQVWIRGD